MPVQPSTTPLPMSRPPEPPRSGRGRALFLTWAISLGILIFDHELLLPLARKIGAAAPVMLMSFGASLIFIALSMYGFAVALRWLLRKLFWRVGRRLFLSYVLIGVFPFFLFAILILTIAYMIAGVMTQAAVRGERQATLGQLESAALEYGLTGKRPPDALKSLEVYDSSASSGEKLPAWLRDTSFSGVLLRDDDILMVATRQFPQPKGPARNVVFVQPIDKEFLDQLEDRSGMKVRVTVTTEHRTSHGRNISSDDDIIQPALRESFGRAIIWPDWDKPADWNTGETADRSVFAIIVNPVTNLFHFYFGAGGDRYLGILVRIIVGITTALLFIYLFAAMFAAILVWSITRAVNRIEKGTKAVERGDFSYRIGMKPANQLGEMAQSFDRMTESIASLLSNVAEKERLQSEIEIAASIQRNLLPKEGPQFRGVSFSAHFEPTASIGGDYYDVFNLDKSRLAVAIGDVSGHGLSTGLVMAMVKAAITTLVEEGADETSLFHRLNELVFRSTERRAFMTLAFTIFDLDRGTIRHTNAGHLYPYLLRNDGPPQAIEVPSLPLGVRSDITTHTEEVPLSEGDVMVYLSDGIVEAQNETGDPFGFDKLESLLATSTDRSTSAIRDRILDAVARHSGTRPADDDRTLMVLRFESLRTSVAEPPVEPALSVTR